VLGAYDVDFIDAIVFHELLQISRANVAFASSVEALE